jgi:hypothetical protein
MSFSLSNGLNRNYLRWREGQHNFNHDSHLGFIYEYVDNRIAVKIIENPGITEDLVGIVSQELIREYLEKNADLLAVDGDEFYILFGSDLNSEQSWLWTPVRATDDFSSSEIRPFSGRSYFDPRPVVYTEPPAKYSVDDALYYYPALRASAEKALSDREITDFRP